MQRDSVTASRHANDEAFPPIAPETFDRYKASGYRCFNQKMARGYDSVYYRNPCQMWLWHRVVVDELRPVLASQRVLDVCCGTGSLIGDFAAAGARSFAGVDLAPNILDVARKKLDRAGVGADLRNADVEQPLPWPDGSFDVATLTAALHHFYRPQDALRSIRRVLRPGGRLIIVDPCFVTPLRQLFNLWLRAFPFDGDYRFYSPDDAMRLVTAAGFACEPPRRVGLWAYMLVATARK